MNDIKWREYISFFTKGLNQIDKEVLADDIVASYKSHNFKDINQEINESTEETNKPDIKVESQSAGVGVWIGRELIFISVWPGQADANATVKNGALPSELVKKILLSTDKLKNVEVRSFHLNLMGSGVLNKQQIESSSNESIRDLLHGKTERFSAEKTSKIDETDNEKVSKFEVTRTSDELFDYELELAYENPLQQSGQRVVDLLKAIDNFNIKAQQDGLRQQAERIIL